MRQCSGRSEPQKAASQEAIMTLTVLDPRTGRRVTIKVGEPIAR